MDRKTKGPYYPLTTEITFFISLSDVEAVKCCCFWKNDIHILNLMLHVSKSCVFLSIYILHIMTISGKWDCIIISICTMTYDSYVVIE